MKTYMGMEVRLQASSILNLGTRWD